MKRENTSSPSHDLLACVCWQRRIQLNAKQRFVRSSEMRRADKAHDAAKDTAVHRGRKPYRHA